MCNVFLVTNQLSHIVSIQCSSLDQTLCLPQTEESREIYHFHYTTWPDFGVPESPASFLNFLFKVRESGSLDPEHGPSVVHCSAGIGRSGTFALVDTCLVLVRRGVGKCHWKSATVKENSFARGSHYNDYSLMMVRWGVHALIVLVCW